MKNKILLKSLFLLLLMFVFSSSSFASEVTGNLSSSRNNIAYDGIALQPNYNNPDISNDTEDLDGVVQVYDNEGAVLGESVVAPVSGGLSIWFWTILGLLLLAISRYIYNRNKNNDLKDYDY